MRDREFSLLNKKYNGLFFSVGKFWKGVYIHVPLKTGKRTTRFFLKNTFPYIGMDGWFRKHNKVAASEYYGELRCGLE